MGYARLSEHEAKNQKLLLDNAFVAEYLPAAPDNYVKIYLTGLSLAVTDPENGPETVAARLMLDAATVESAFAYWQEQGLVHLTDATPPGVEYLPVVPRVRQIRKFSKEKYRTFNDQLHVLFPHRNILPGEYNEYYNVMETYNIEIEAMLTVIGYCKRLKGEEITYPYIVAVARNLANEGITSFDRVSERLSELDLYSKELTAVLKAMGSRRTADHEDKRNYDKWTKSFGFTQDTVVHVAKSVKKGGMARLDAQLTKYYENRLMSVHEIEEYEKNRDRLYELAKKINRIIGVFYEQLDFIIETYIGKWLSMGFGEEALTTVADYCFRKGIRTLAGMDETLQKFFKQGCVSVGGIHGFIADAVKSDEGIRALLEKAGLDRAVTSRDRDFYRTWTYSWKLCPELISYAAELSRSAGNPMGYMNVLLSSWHEAGCDTVEKAKSAARPLYAPAAAHKPDSRNVVSNAYSADELNAVFDNLDKEPL